MQKFSRSIAMSALGALAMYYLDPARGPQRRTLALDRLDSASREAGALMHEQRRRAAEQVRHLGDSARRSFSQASGALESHGERAGFERMTDADDQDNSGWGWGWGWDRARASMADMSHHRHHGNLSGSPLKAIGLCAVPPGEGAISRPAGGTNVWH